MSLDVPMDEARAVDRGERVAEVDADGNGFAHAHRTLHRELLFQGAAGNQLHPQTEVPVVRIRAKHPDDIPVAQARQQPRLLDHT